MTTQQTMQVESCEGQRLVTCSFVIGAIRISLRIIHPVLVGTQLCRIVDCHLSMHVLLSCNQLMAK